MNIIAIKIHMPNIPIMKNAAIIQITMHIIIKITMQ